MPAFADEFVSSEATGSFESFDEVASGHEVCRVSVKLSVVVVVVALNGGLFDGSIHAFDLAVDPRMIGFGRALMGAGARVERSSRISSRTSSGRVALMGSLSTP